MSKTAIILISFYQMTVLPVVMACLENSSIPDNLIAQYHSTNYQIGIGSDVFTLSIDQHSESLAQLMAIRHADCAAIITAHNPFSQLQNPEKNLAAHLLLAQALNQYSDSVIPCTNIDPTGSWPPEEGFLALGLTVATAQRIGRQFNQNAIVWVDSHAVPTLILLR